MAWKVFDCSEYNPNCAARDQTIEANPDIAGIGVRSLFWLLVEACCKITDNCGQVVVSFLMTTCLAFLIAFTVIFLDRYEQVINLYRKYISKRTADYEQNYNGPYWRSTHFWSRV